VDQAELDFLTQQNMQLMHLDPSILNNTSEYIQQQQQQLQQQQQHQSNSTNSFNMLKQQYYLQQQQYQDFTSFETIKKVLFNGNVVACGLGSNLSSSGVGAATTISPNRVVLHAANAGATLLNAYKTSSNSMQNRSSVDNESNQSSDMQAEANLKIINDFKQKPFDELMKSTLLKSDNNYNDVFELISKEMNGDKDVLSSSSGKHHHGGHHHHHHHHHANSHGPAVTSASSLTANGGVVVVGGGNAATLATDNNDSTQHPASNNKNVSHSSLSTNSNNSSSIGTTGSNAALLLKETFQQKNTPLNDIEFPELFMYG
jgi:hypothetical protein